MLAWRLASVHSLMELGAWIEACWLALFHSTHVACSHTCTCGAAVPDEVVYNNAQLSAGKELRGYATLDTTPNGRPFTCIC